jgi:hypothetical protein
MVNDRPISAKMKSLRERIVAVPIGRTQKRRGRPKKTSHKEGFTTPHHHEEDAPYCYETRPTKTFAMSDDDKQNNDLPRNVLSRKNRGWQGQELEQERTFQEDSQQSFAAVDVNQFRNTVVGQGYQAKHVVRQKGIDLNQARRKSEEGTSIGKAMNMLEEATSTARISNRQDNVEEDNESARLQKYLSCEAFRRFRKELAKIETQS